MPLAADLLDQAQHLAHLDPRRPKQANLRRAISTAYYALFHLLVAECVQKIAPRNPATLAARVARSLAHSEMKEVCLQISRANRGAIWIELLPRGSSVPLRRVAEAFVELQEARHRADYDLAEFTRLEVNEYLLQAGAVFHDWSSIRDSDEANVFLCGLLFAKRWAK
jgi:uncharacterized protein (UPF0332 family)